MWGRALDVLVHSNIRLYLSVKVGPNNLIFPLPMDRNLYFGFWRLQAVLLLIKDWVSHRTFKLFVRQNRCTVRYRHHCVFLSSCWYSNLLVVLYTSIYAYVFRHNHRSNWYLICFNTSWFNLVVILPSFRSL